MQLQDKMEESLQKISRTVNWALLSYLLSFLHVEKIRNLKPSTGVLSVEHGILNA